VYSGMCCSAGIWASAYSTEIYATSQTDQVGCIGVVARINKAADNGVEHIYSDLSPNKNAEFRDAQVLKDNYLNPVAKMFQDTVVQGRKGKIKADSSILSGETLIATDAKKQGLIDGVMPFAQIVKRANYLSKKNKMEGTATAFNKTLVTAKADAFAVTDEGFSMSEENLQNIETALTNAEATQAQLTTVTEQLTALQSQQAITAQTIANLQAENTALKAGPAAIVPDPSLTADPVNGENKYHTSYDDEKAKLKAKYGSK
jgi:ClpP class serine protease